MILMPGKNDFNGRFNWYRWSAPVCENPKELIETIQNSGMLGKKLRSVRVIGETLPRLAADAMRGEQPQEAVINCLKAFEPFIFEFEDGSTLDFLPQGHLHSRLGFSSIPSGVRDGLTFATPSFQHFFYKAADQIWKGAVFSDIEVQTVKKESRIYSERKVSEREEEYEVRYRFHFKEAYENCSSDSTLIFELISEVEHNEYLVSLGGGWSRLWVGADWLKAQDGALGRKKHNCWSMVPYGGFLRIYPLDDENAHDIRWGEDEKDHSPFECFIFRQAVLCVEGEGVPVCLEDILSRRYDPSINCDYGLEPGYEHYGENLYSFAVMKGVLNDVRGYIDRIKNGPLFGKDAELILRWANGYPFYGKGDSDLNEAGKLLIDFLDQFCQAVEGMMSVCPHFKTIMVMGP